MIFLTHPSRICDAPPLSTRREGGGSESETEMQGG